MIENITPIATATLDALQGVPLENIAYVPTDVFVQYQYIQMIIDGVVAGATGWFVRGWVEKRRARKADLKRYINQPRRET
jgi:hypothetical protein